MTLVICTIRTINLQQQKYFMLCVFILPFHLFTLGSGKIAPRYKTTGRHILELTEYRHCSCNWQIKTAHEFCGYQIWLYQNRIIIPRQEKKKRKMSKMPDKETIIYFSLHFNSFCAKLIFPCFLKLSPIGCSHCFLLLPGNKKTTDHIYDACWYLRERPSYREFEYGNLTASF